MNWEVSLTGTTLEPSVLCHRNGVTRWRQAPITCRSLKSFGGTGKKEGLKCVGSEESWLHFAQQFKTEVANSEVFEREPGDDTLCGNDPGGM